MKRAVIAVALAVGLAAGYGAAAADTPAKPSGAAGAAKVADGSPVFLKYRCSSCHSIEAQGIKKKAVAAEAGVEVAESGSKPADLSGVGAVRKAEWMTAFLLKQEKLGGKLHIKKFRGTEEELNQLVSWLATLKDEAAAKKLRAAEEMNAAKKGAAPAEPEATSEIKGDK